jgi:superfamily II DNA or RNA helicase
VVCSPVCVCVCVCVTRIQVEAIVAGLQPGLTMVVGPPGTGKTDTAVQIMHVLYHTCPEQRTLLITHSNQALNDLFAKIMEVLSPLSFDRTPCFQYIHAYMCPFSESTIQWISASVFMD